MTYHVVIPALDEEKSLPGVLQSLRSLERPPRKIYVVDNGSTDRTPDVAKEGGAVCLSQPTRGYGIACLTALREIFADPQSLANKDIIVFMDADGSDNPEEIPLLLEPILRGQAQAVIGSRTLGNPEHGSLGSVQRFGNALSCFLLKHLMGAKFTDLGPFRAIEARTLHSLGMRDQNFGWTVEMQAKIALQKIAYREVAVDYRKRFAGESKVSGNLLGGFLAGKKILSTIFSLWLSHWVSLWASQISRRSIISFLLMGMGFCYMAAVPSQAQTLEIFSAAFFCYAILAFSLLPGSAPSPNVQTARNFYFTTGIVLRIPFLFFLPGLTNDYYRTLWDANLLLSGVNPYTHTPTDILTHFDAFHNLHPFTDTRSHLGPSSARSWSEGFPFSWQEMYPLLNSQNFHSFYPPLHHGLAVVSVALGNFLAPALDWKAPVYILRILFFGFEIWTLRLWKRFPNTHPSYYALYAWNPLVVWEGIGNLHFEILSIGFLLKFFLVHTHRTQALPLGTGKTLQSGLHLMLSIWSKGWSVVLLPLVFLQGIGCYFRKFSLPPIKTVTRTALLLFFPVVGLGVWGSLVVASLPEQMDSGLGLYSHSFEFFSGFNRLVRIGLAEWGWEYGATGAILWLLCASWMGIYLAIRFPKNLAQPALVLYNILLVCSPVIHPWYLIPWQALGILNRKTYPFLGSFLIFASYSYYTHEIYERNEIIVWTTYLIFGLYCIWENYEHKYRRNRCGNSSRPLRHFH